MIVSFQDSELSADALNKSMPIPLIAWRMEFASCCGFSPFLPGRFPIETPATLRLSLAVMMAARLEEKAPLFLVLDELIRAIRVQRCEVKVHGQHGGKYRGQTPSSPPL